MNRFALLSLLIASSGSYAGSYYAGVGLGNALVEKSEVSLTESNIDVKTGSSLSGKVYAGWLASNNFGVEVDYMQTGSINSEIDVHKTGTSINGKLSNDVTVNSYDVLGVYYLPLSKSSTNGFALKLGLGLGYKTLELEQEVQFEDSSGGSQTFKSNGFVPTAIAGVEYKFTDNLSILGEYQYWDRSVEDVDDANKVIYENADRTQAFMLDLSYKF